MFSLLKLKSGVLKNSTLNFLPDLNEKYNEANKHKKVE